MPYVLSSSPFGLPLYEAVLDSSSVAGENDRSLDLFGVSFSSLREACLTSLREACWSSVREARSSSLRAARSSSLHEACSSSLREARLSLRKARLSSLREAYLSARFAKVMTGSRGLEGKATNVVG
ncbi:hypothetical protein ACLB2K_026725 [Fragaria x ananassa]